MNVWPGRARRAPVATRKFARAARRQELAGNLGAAGAAGGGSRLGSAEGTAGTSALDRLVQVMRRQERTDKCGNSLSDLPSLCFSIC